MTTMWRKGGKCRCELERHVSCPEHSEPSIGSKSIVKQVVEMLSARITELPWAPIHLPCRHLGECGVSEMWALVFANMHADGHWGWFLTGVPDDNVLVNNERLRLREKRTKLERETEREERWGMNNWFVSDKRNEYSPMLLQCRSAGDFIFFHTLMM